MNPELRRLFDVQRSVESALATTRVRRSPHIVELARNELVHQLLATGDVASEALHDRACALLDEVANREALAAVMLFASETSGAAGSYDSARKARAARRQARERIGMQTDESIEARLALAELRRLLLAFWILEENFADDQCRDEQ